MRALAIAAVFRVPVGCFVRTIEGVEGTVKYHDDQCMVIEKPNRLSRLGSGRTIVSVPYQREGKYRRMNNTVEVLEFPGNVINLDV